MKLNILYKKNVYLFSFLFFISYYFLGHSLVYQSFLGNIPVLEGFYTRTAIFFFLLILVYSFFISFPFEIYTVVSFMLIIYIFSVILFNYWYDGNDDWLRNINLEIVLYYLMFFFAGKYFYNVHKYYYFVLVLYLFMVIEKLLFLDLSTFHIIIRDADGTVNTIYLFLGDSFAIISILLISLTKKKEVKLVLIVLSIFCLWIMFTRTSLYAFILVMLLFLYKEYSLSFKFFFLLAFITAIVVISYSYNDLASNRMLSFIMTGKDGSWSDRQLQFRDGIEGIRNHPIFGDYGGQYYKSFIFGSYMHNILSYYRQFGLVVILALFFLIIKMFKSSYSWYKNAYNKEIDYIFYLFFFIMIEQLFSRNYTSPDLWLMFGVFSNLNKWKKK